MSESIAWAVIATNAAAVIALVVVRMKRRNR